jgi:hypothetical protein
MASRRKALDPSHKPATVAAGRAAELLRKQVDEGRALLAKGTVDRLAFETWEQTSRAVVAAAFGEPSESITRFERASPAYPGRAGGSDAFWTQYRRDELEAKVSALGSCITQLEMGLAPAGAPEPAGTHQDMELDVADIGELARIEGLMESDEMRAIVIRDLAELKHAIRFGLAKSILLLAGSILAGLLVDVLDRNRAVASSYMRKRRFPEDASLPDLIGIAGDATLLDANRYLLTPTSTALAKALTDHRDLIHPHAEARGRIRVDKATAHALVHLLGVVVRDLNEARQRGDVQAYVDK